MSVFARLFAATLIATLALSSSAGAADNDTVLISTEGSAFAVSMSDDGRYVAYVDDDGEAVREDLLTGEVVALSRHEAGGAPANDLIDVPQLSADGRYAAFGSTDQDLDQDYDDGFPVVSVVQIYLRDIDAEETTLASRADGANGPSADSFAELGGLSDDGRYVSFKTSDDLGTGSSTFNHYFRRDLQTNTTVQTNVDGDEVPVEGAGGELPRISGNGRFVILMTAAEIAGDDTDGDTDVYRRDVAAGTTEMVSRGSTGNPIVGNVYSRAISGDGSKLLLHTDEQLVAADTNSDTDTYLKEVGGPLTLVSRADGANGAVETGDSFPSGPGSLSTDGRFASFRTEANLDPDHTDSTVQLYMRDVTAGTTELISRPDGSATGVGNGASTGGQVSLNGGFVAFRSSASNLNPADTTTDDDIFRRELSLEAPELTATDPASPADDVMPLVSGTAPAGSEVRVFGDTGLLAANDGCPGEVVGTGTASGGGEFEIEVTVQSGQTTTLRADATDEFDRTSACSASSLTYVELGDEDNAVDRPTLKGKKKQKQKGKKIQIKLKLGAGEDVTAVAKGKIKVKGGKGFKLKKRKASIDGGKRAKVKLVPKKKKDGKKIAKLLARGKKLSAATKVKFKDEAGNTAKKKLKVKLKAKR